MSVQTTGNVNWLQTTYPVWTVDGFGTDVATVKFSGLASLKEQYENALIKWSSLPQYQGNLGQVQIPPYPWMYLENWTDAEGTKNIYNLDLHYRGFRNGQIPLPKSVDDLSFQSAQGQGTDTAYIDPATGQNAVVTGSIFYYASRTTWTWFSLTQPPATPPSPYNTINNPINPFTTIFRYSINTIDPNTGEAGGPVNAIDTGAFTAIFNSLAATTVVSTYKRELIIPNQLWGCEATLDYKLVGPGGS